jgi:hypothetical protein
MFASRAGPLDRGRRSSERAMKQAENVHFCLVISIMVSIKRNEEGRLQ